MSNMNSGNTGPENIDIDENAAGNATETEKAAEKEKKATRVRDRINSAANNFFETPFGSRLKSHFDKNGYLYCAFIIPVALFWMVFIIMKTYPFGNGSALVLDLNGQYVYFFEALRKAVYGDASLLYSWCGTMGGEFVGIYAYYLASPLSYLVALFPQTAMTEAILFIELLKCGLCGVTMAFYLRKTRPKANEMITISISVMYALCAYVVVYGHNMMWMDSLIWLPLLVYGIEQLITRGNFRLFTVALAMTVLSNFYIGYMVCIFTAVYFFYYYFFASDGKNNYLGERKHFIKSILRIAGAAVTALLIACVIILPIYYSLSLGKNEFSNPDYSFKFKFNPLEFISKLFIASYDTVRPEGNPFTYCGMLTLVLVPVYFISARVSRRQKIGAAAILLFFFLSMIISPLDMAWHGFQNPNWLNYRYSFMFSFILLVLAHRALELFHTVRLKKTIIIAAVWAVLVGICALTMDDDFFTESITRRMIFFVAIPIIMLVIYEILHHMLLKDRLNSVVRSSVLTTLSIVICFEMFIGCLLGTTSLNEDVTFSPKYTADSGKGLEGYDNFLDKLRPVVAMIQTSDGEFYRMEKEVYRKACDNFALNMRGVTGSTSTLNKKTIAFLNNLGFVSKSQWSRYKGSTSVADSLLGIKYLIFSDKQYENDYYLTEKGEYNYDDQKYIYYYLNEYALSLAYASSEDIKELNVRDTASPFVLMNNIITALLGEEETVEVFKVVEYTYEYNEDDVDLSFASYNETVYDIYGEPVPDLDKDGNLQYNDEGEIKYEKKLTPYLTFSTKSGSDEKIEIKFSITMPDDIDPDTELFFKIPTNYNRTCTWTFGDLDGTCFENETDCILSLGTLGPGESGTLELTVNGDDDPDTIDKFYMDNSEGTGKGVFYYVDEELYKDVMTRLAHGNFVIDEYTEESFYGSINAPSGMTTVFTTIPYEKYWTVKVDGEEVKTDMTCAALLCFDLPSAGEHEISIEYKSDPVKYGLILSGAGVLIFAVAAVLDITVFSAKRKAKWNMDVSCLSESDYESDLYDDEYLSKKKKLSKHRNKKHK